MAIASERLKTYRNKVNIVFEELNKMLELIIEKESVSEKELKQLKSEIDKIKNSLNKPTE